MPNKILNTRNYSLLLNDKAINKHNILNLIMKNLYILLFYLLFY